MTAPRRRTPTPTPTPTAAASSGRPRAVLYHRASSLDQDPTLAREELQRAAEARGFEVLATVEESGSGAANDRPGLQRTLDLARRGEIAAVITWKLDRYGRSALDLLANLQQLEDAGVRFIAVTQGIDLRAGGDPMSRLLRTMLAAVAEFERDLIIERTRLGVARARERGIRLGRPPSLTATEARLACLRRKQGASWREIAAELHCTVGAARRAVQRAEKGVAAEGLDVAEIARPGEGV